MDQRTLRFAVFTAVSALSLLLGYLSRRRGWLPEESSNRIHFFTVTWLWGIGGALGLWRLPLKPELLWLLIILPICMGLSVAAIIPAAKAIGCNRSQVGVMAIGAGIINGGMTLGTYLCYCILQPHEDALAYGAFIGSLNLIIAVPMVYPLAKNYSLEPGHREPALPLIFWSIVNVRSIGLLASTLGILLSAVGAPFPRFVLDYYILDSVIFAAAIGTYFGIGLRLRLGDSIRSLPHHSLLAGIRFGLFPLSAWLLLTLLAATGAPPPALLHQTILVQATMPTGTSMVILANLFKLDARLASVLWLWNTTLFLLVPLPLIFWLVN